MAEHIPDHDSDAAENLRGKSPASEDEIPGSDTAPASGSGTNSGTNLVMADIAMRAGSSILRNVVEKSFLSGRYGKDTASDIVNNKTLGQTVASVVLAKMATRSVPGAVIIGSGVVVKTLFDRSQKRRKAKKAADTAGQDIAKRD